MASKNHEELATIMVKEVMEARDNEEYRLASEYFNAIGHSFKYATERSRLECDIRRFVKYDEPGLYHESDFEKMTMDLSKKLGRPVHFRTRPLWECLVSKLSKELQNNQDFWQTAKIIYSYISTFQPTLLPDSSKISVLLLLVI